MSRAWAQHVDAAKRFILANPGEEGAIEKEMKESIVRTPPDRVCAQCHTVQAHGSHPAYVGQPARPATGRQAVSNHVVMTSDASGPWTIGSTTVPHYSVKTCGGCHYDQFKSWSAGAHASLWKSLPAKYVNDESCLKCHGSQSPAMVRTAAVETTTTSGATSAATTTVAGAEPHWIGLACETCHGPAWDHVRFVRQYISGPRLSPALEQIARNMLRTGKPAATCSACHLTVAHKPHPDYEKAGLPP